MRAGRFMHSRARTLLTGFDNARIRNKLLAGFAAVVLPLVALGVATLLATGTARSEFYVFATRELPKDTAIDEVETGTMRLLAAFNHFVSITLASHYADNIALIPGGFDSMTSLRIPPMSADLRAVVHDEGEGRRPRLADRPQACRTAWWNHRRREHGRRGNHLHGLAAAAAGSNTHRTCGPTGGHGMRGERHT